MFESTLYLLVRQKTCYYVAYKWMESNVYTVCIVTKMLCNTSFEMTKSVVMCARVVVTNCIYPMKYNCLIIQYTTSIMCVCVRKSMFIVRHNCAK